MSTPISARSRGPRGMSSSSAFERYFVVCTDTIYRTKIFLLLLLLLKARIYGLWAGLNVNQTRSPNYSSPFLFVLEYSTRLDEEL